MRPSEKDKENELKSRYDVSCLQAQSWRRVNTSIPSGNARVGRAGLGHRQLPLLVGASESRVCELARDFLRAVQLHVIRAFPE